MHTHQRCAACGSRGCARVDTYLDELRRRKPNWTRSLQLEAPPARVLELPLVEHRLVLSGGAAVRECSRRIPRWHPLPCAADRFLERLAAGRPGAAACRSASTQPWPRSAPRRNGPSGAAATAAAGQPLRESARMPWRRHCTRSPSTVGTSGLPALAATRCHRGSTVDASRSELRADPRSGDGDDGVRRRCRSRASAVCTVTVAAAASEPHAGGGRRPAG